MTPLPPAEPVALAGITFVVLWAVWTRELRPRLAALFRPAAGA